MYFPQYPTQSPRLVSPFVAFGFIFYSFVLFSGKHPHMPLLLLFCPDSQYSYCALSPAPVSLQPPWEHWLGIPRAPGPELCAWQVFKVITELKTQPQESSFLMTPSISEGRKTMYEQHQCHDCQNGVHYIHDILELPQFGGGGGK